MCARQRTGGSLGLDRYIAKICEQKEYRKQEHRREPGMVGAGMEHFREWVCEMQVETADAASRLCRNSALKRRISDASPVSVTCQ